MGVVYEAIDHDHNARIALKCLPSLSPEAVVLFKNEFRALQDMHHPNLVTLHELISEEDQLFFTMELVDGVDIVSYVRGDAVDFDEARLRDCYAQLTRGLLAIHDCNKIHRDVKPSNVLVEASGRVVLLDFGLVTDGLGEAARGHLPRAGTAPYMAPEHGPKGRLGPDIDWYSVGVMLYETLTHRRPFSDGAPQDIAKRDRPPLPSSVAPGVPDDLCRLCHELLDPDPAARPKGRDVLRRISPAVPELDSRAPRPLPWTTLVGRDNELAKLRRGFDRTLDGRPCTVEIEGESGIGKSALMRHFIESLARETSPVLTLTGCCAERESIPYKAFDGIVEGLANYLMKLSDDQLFELVGDDIGIMAQSFPILSRVLARVPSSEPDIEDPHVRRNQVFLSLRQLLIKLVDRQRVVICVDDLQWADADSLALLHATMRLPGAPGILLVVSRRYAGGTIFHFPGEVERIALSNLSLVESSELAHGLLLRHAEGCDISDRAADFIARETKGHPFLIHELVRQMLAQGGRLPAVVRLEEALWSRVQGLDEPMRHIIELLAVAGAPLAISVLVQALARGDTPFASEALPGMLSALRCEHLVRTMGNRASDFIEVYHESIARAVLTHLSPIARRTYHEYLALVLEIADDSESGTMAMHWQGAGRPEKAARHALDAAAQAMEALAFERAARLYRWSLELVPEHEDAPLIQEDLGDALANAGKGPEAASAYLAAAEAGGPEQRDLERRAADQLFRSGYVDQAREIIARVLQDMDIAFPRTARGGLVALLFRRAQIRLRGLEFRERSAHETSATDLARIDACWSVAVGLSMVDNIRGAYLQSRHLLLALDYGEPLRVVRALAAEAAYVAAAGGSTRRQSERLLGTAKGLLERVGDPYAVGFTALSSGICAFLVGNWTGALEGCELAEWTFERRPGGVRWELASARAFSLWSRFYLGQYRALAQRVPVLLREAEGRGDLYAATYQRSGLLNTAWLVEDDPLEARRSVLQAERQWSQNGFQFQHYLNALASSQIDLYEGNGAAAYGRIVDCWPLLQSSLHLRIQGVRIEALFLRARGALAACGADRSQRDLLADAERCAKRMLREKSPWADPLARLVLAGAAFSRQRREDALGHLDAAERLAERAGMMMFRAAASWQKGELLGGDEGHRLVSDAEVRMSAEGIRNPPQMVTMLAPGFQPKTTLGRPRFVLPPRP